MDHACTSIVWNTSQVHRCDFWMLLYGAPTSKRTWCYSNMREVHFLDAGKLTRAVREEKTKKKLTRSLVAIHQNGFWLKALFSLHPQLRALHEWKGRGQIPRNRRPAIFPVS